MNYECFIKDKSKLINIINECPRNIKIQSINEKIYHKKNNRIFIATAKKDYLKFKVIIKEITNIKEHNIAEMYKEVEFGNYMGFQLLLK